MALHAVILGAPGAGKGTQAARIAQRLGLKHLSTGDLLRGAVAAGTPAGRQARQFMEAGQLVPDEVVFGVLFDALGDRPGDTDLWLDGFPRNAAQAEELDRRLSAAGTQLDVVVDLDVPDAGLVQRITGRRVCRQCGANSHVEFMPTEKEGVCDACGGETYQRADDNEETVASRLAVYHEQTAPLKGYYRSQDLLSRVDGDRSPDEVTADLAALFESVASGTLGGC